jgi:hypothetical protein
MDGVTYDTGALIAADHNTPGPTRLMNARVWFVA